TGARLLKHSAAPRGGSGERPEVQRVDAYPEAKTAVTAKLIITGFMATGKSSVGHLVARRLGWQFADTDLVVVTLAGKSVPEIFALHGESYFRALEREAIATLT